MKKRYVYYDKTTGEIKDILSKKKPGRALNIECSNEEVEGFILGTKGINQWVVAYNRDIKKHILLEKNNIIRLRKPSSKLYKIPYKKDIENDLRIVYYSDNVIEVVLDVSRISTLYQTNFGKEVAFEKGTDIRIFLKEKNSGNLIKEFIINAQNLLDSGQMFFELPADTCSDNIEFFTYNLFGSYSWSKGMFRLMSPIKNRIKFDVHKADTEIKSKNFSYHLIIEPTSTGIKIKNNIESLKLIRFYKEIEFFIVDKHDPNILCDKFFLNENDLSHKEIIIDLKESLIGRSILYNHKYISVLVKG